MNTHQCFSGPYYPRPINTTRRRLAQLISGNGTTTIVYPDTAIAASECTKIVQ